MIRTSNVFFILLIIICGCSGNEKNNKKPLMNTQTNKIKDTINVNDIYDEISESLIKGESLITLNYFNKYHQPVKGLEVGDTFFIKVIYESNKFDRLNKNYEIKLLHAKGNFKFLYDKEEKKVINQFKLEVDTNADTIEFDVHLKSNQYVFREFLKTDGKSKQELFETIGLLRKIEVVK